jgi:hypothetical protein
MRNLLTIVAATALLSLAAPDAVAQKKSDKVSGKGAAKAEQMRDQAEKRAGKDVMDEDDAEEARERAEDMREEAEERAAEGRERAEEGAGDGGMRGQDNAASRGSEKSQEMRARRDERKQIQEEYREGRESGDDAIDGDDMIDSDDSTAKKKEKKPWWKFWGD